MRPSKAQYVTASQQLLVLSAVLAVLTPAASVISLDVVQTPGTSSPHARTSGPGGLLPDADRSAGTGGGTAATPPEVAGRQARVGRDALSEVPAGPVTPTVTEVALTPAGDGEDAGTRRRVRPDSSVESARPPRATRRSRTPAPTTVLSTPEPVEGYGAVGVTWSSEEQVDDEDIRLEVRTSTDRVWSDWTDLEYHDEHAPEPASDEGEAARPGTDPLLVGTVDLVQVRAVASHGLPRDMSLAVVAPGKPADVDLQTPRVTTEAPPPATPDGSGTEGPEDGIELQAATSSAPQPRIFSRRQWGANERLRDGSPRYGTISAGFVHHTVNSNGYTRAQVPGILRSIYAYHTQSRGWSDIGYNFLVDRFGRIWEGRAGGVARPVVGAHTYGYNEDSFAMSAIGNFDTVRPSRRMLRAYGRLFAWKLGLHGVDPMDRSQRVNGDTFRAINGHRDAGSTACPGRYLYAKMRAIRRMAAAAGSEVDSPEPEPEPEPDPVSLRQVDSDLVGTPFPDLVVRRRSDGRGVILPTGGLSAFRKPSVVTPGWGSRTTLAVPDLTGDGRVDVVTFDRRGGLEIRPRLESGAVGEVRRTVRRFRGTDVVASVGDVNGDSRPDFVARAKGRLVAFLGNRRGGFRRAARPTGLRGYVQLVGAGDVTGDRRPDLWGRDRRGRLFWHRGLGRGRFADRVLVPGTWTGYDWLVGGIDYTEDGVPDLIARRGNGALMILPSRGNGSLGRPVGPVHGRGLAMISGAGQLTGTDAPDLLATRADGSLVVAENRGTFDLGVPLDTGQSFRRGNLLLNAGDFTGDGHGDVLMRRRIGSLWLYAGDGTGRLASPRFIGGKRAFRKVSGLRVTADVTGDGRHDVVGRIAGKGTIVWPGNGAERLGKGAVVRVEPPKLQRPTGTDYTWLVPISDLRRRGPADLVVRDGEGYLYRLNGGRRGYRSPRYLGEARAYNLGG